MANNPKRFMYFSWALAALVLLSLFFKMGAEPVSVPITASTLIREMQAGNIQRFTFVQGSLGVTAVLKSKNEGRPGERCAVDLVNEGQVDDIRKLADADRIPYDVHAPPNPLIGAMFMNLGWVVLFVLAWWFFILPRMNGQADKAMGFGRSRAKLVSGSQKTATFSDVAGCDEAKEDLQEVVAFLRDPAKFSRLGGKLPRGTLLFGPPGTGKTLLAKAVAGEAGVPFFSTSGSEFVEMFVGVGASRVRDLFNQAKSAGRAVIFIDELDAIGRHRFAGIGGGHDEREQTLNQILVELDGFDTRDGVIVIAATNRPDVLDAALLRPGRFSRLIAVPPPNMQGRESILKVHARGIRLDAGVDLRVIARRTSGFVGADLANLLNEAALLAARYERETVLQEDIEGSIDKIMAGAQQKSHRLSDYERKIVAYHESGHTLAAKLTEGTEPVHKVSIIPRGRALGYTLQLPEQDRHLTSKKEMLNRLRVLVGGRVAEEILLGADGVTAGACDDLTKATALLQQMVMEYGLGSWVSVVSPKGQAVNRLMIEQSLPPCSANRHEAMEAEIEKILRETLASVKELLAKHRNLLDAMAGKLMEQEELNGTEIDALIRQYHSA